MITSSSSVLAPSVRLGAYVASKYAITGYGEVLRLELAREGIGVTLLFPAGMSTRHLESSRAARPRELGPSVTLPDDIDAIVAGLGNGAAIATPRHAVRNLVAEVLADQAYVITHGNYRAQVEDRFAQILAAFARMDEDV